MSKNHPETLATKSLKALGLPFEGHVYEYEEHGGTRVSAQKLGVDEFAVLKTLVMQNENREPMLVLMHGTQSVSTKALARAAQCKTIEPCSPEVAQKHSGYLVGGTSPFGAKKKMPVYLEESALALPRIWVNGGRRGFLVSMVPSDLVRGLGPILVNVGLEK
jgi:Cys-tRNA(Pro) deacylase